MTLPPDPNQFPLDNQDDPLGGMDPLAWLESLAKRQGVDPDQLTTDADLDIAMPPEDAVVDGPGYTPGYDVHPSAEPARNSAPADPVPRQPPVQPPPPPEPVIDYPDHVPAPIDPMSDPIAFMESLARNQGVDPSQLTTKADLIIEQPPADAVVDGPGYTPGYDVHPSAESTQTEPIQRPPPPAPEPVIDYPDHVPAPIDPMSDPIAFMESLARNQGVDPSQLTTKADLIIEQPPADAVVDGPGYTPGYDVHPSAADRQAAEPVNVAPPVEIPQAVQPELPPVRPTPFVPARPTPFVPAAQSPAPPVPLPTPVQAAPVPPAPEPIAPIAPPEPVPVPMQPAASVSRAPVDLPDITDPLAWLESLTTPHPTSNLEYAPNSAPSESELDNAMSAEDALAWLEQLTHENPSAQPVADQSWLPVTPATVDESGGLSNDMDEIQQWLTDQATTLGSLHDLPEAEIPASDEPAMPVSPGALPDWLNEQMITDDADTETLLPLTDQLGTPPMPEGLPDWLTQNLEQPADEQAVVLPDLSADQEEYDPWIAALEEEENRQRANDESVPDWYTEALARNSGSIPALNATTDQPVSEAIESDVLLPDAVPQDELPSWLQALAPDDSEGLPVASVAALSPTPAAEPQFDDEDMPDWLRDAAPTPAETLPLGNLVSAENDDLPDWLRMESESAGPVPQPPLPAPVDTTSLITPPLSVPPVAAPLPIAQPIPEPIKPPPAPIAPPTPKPVPQPAPQPIPVPAGFDPDYHLQQAQYHASQQNYRDSLGHYQTLIDQSASLDEVVAGVSAVVAAQPNDPRARRLLGDAHLRKGNLQEALDTYRSALDKL